ncbi:acyltransferase [Puteibacter caeruleilacunae]|nr:acyltransferase [Puteibacter caeruleilacunae]
MASFTFKFLRKIGLNYSETQYGDVSAHTVIKKVFKTYRDAFLLKYFMNSVLLSPLSPRKLRPWVFKTIGCNVGKDVFIGDHVIVDSGYSHLITLEDHVHIAGGVRLLCHQRDLRNYHKGDDYAKLGYITRGIHLKKGCLIGMECFVLPGVTVGEGAIVGAGSLVTKDIPAWTIATGRPARVVKKIEERKDK